MNQNENDVRVWVIDQRITNSCLERLGDARQIADLMQTKVGVLLVGQDEIAPDANHVPISSDANGDHDPDSQLIHRGADLVLVAKRAAHESAATSSSAADTGSLTAFSKVDTAIGALAPFSVQLVFAGGDPTSREWAALLAAKTDWRLISPALMVECRRGGRIVTHVHHSGRKSCQVELPEDQPVVVTMGAGVAEACQVDPSRTGETKVIPVIGETHYQSRVEAADPATVDIRDANRLVSGGRGLGSREGFDLLREVAHSLNAGIAASRMAVDLGWIEYERQVGQTGKTVAPDLYIACGISGASHHLQGMAEARHVVAINTDATAPIMKSAHLALVADLYPVLQYVRQRLNR